MSRARRTRSIAAAAAHPLCANAPRPSSNEQPAAKSVARSARRRVRQSLCVRLSTITARLRTDEIAVLTLIAERLLRGRERYGELRVATDRRDFVREALEEAADGLAYAAAALMRRRGSP